MKKITILIPILAAFLSTSFAQGVYFRAGVGYGLPIASQVIGEKQEVQQDYRSNAQINNSSTKNVSGSYGSGMNFNLGGGFMFNEFLGAELNVQYSQGKKYETGNSSTYLSDSYTSSQKLVTQNFSKGIYLNPSFVITTNRGSKIPYGRFGVILGAPKVMGEESSTSEVSYYPDIVNVRTRKWEYTKGLTVGFQGSVGMNWMLSDKIDLFTEVNFVSMTYYAEEYELTEDNNNGYDNLQNYTVAQKQITFKKEIDETQVQDPTKPSEELREAKAFSSISLQVGIRYSLSGHGGD
ncbi:MAG: hypothetical protein ABI663_14350 [Chryseolinea sp.]